jgi:hypothetical protein
VEAVAVAFFVDHAVCELDRQRQFLDIGARDVWIERASSAPTCGESPVPSLTGSTWSNAIVADQCAISHTARLNSDEESNTEAQASCRLRSRQSVIAGETRRLPAVA